MSIPTLSLRLLPALLAPLIACGPLQAQFTFTSGQATGGSSTGAGQVSFNANFPNNVAPARFTGFIGGTHSLYKFGTGIIRIEGTNAYSGTTTIAAGILELAGGNNSIGAGTIRGNITIYNNQGLITSTINALGWREGEKVDSIYSDGGTFYNTATGDQGWGVRYTFSNAGGLMSSNNGHNDVANNTASSPSYFTLGNYGGASALRLINPFNTTVRVYGRVDLRTDDGYSNIVLDVSTMGTLAMHAALTESLTPGAGITKIGGGNLELRAINTYTGTTIVNGGALSLINEYHSPNNGVGTLRGNITISSGTVYLNNPNVLGYLTGEKVNGITIGGQGSLINSANADQGWGIAYNFTGSGNMSTNGGTASATTGSKFSFGNNTTVTVAASSNPTISGRVDLRSDLNPNTDFTIDTNSKLNVSAAVTGGGGINKYGPGTLALTGPVSYTGATNVAAGTLEVRDGTLSGAVSGGGTILKTGPTSFTLSGTSPFAGTWDVAAGNIVISSAANLGATSSLILRGTALQTT
ncbi:MAG: autotransporter-associated beta strand repeat-containing protein, partial [Verrucomicrobiota bacterium]